MRGILVLSTIAVMAAPAILWGAAPILPGLWETTVTINSADMPNAPPSVAKMMQGHKTVVKRCATAKEVAQGPQEMLKSSKSCHFTRYTMAGGHFSSEMVCNMSGTTMTAHSEGHFTPVSFEATSSTQMNGRQSMRMTTSVVGRRLGDCH